jgi:hypothetical protein
MPIVLSFVVTGDAASREAGIAAVKAVAAAFCKNALRSICNMRNPWGYFGLVLCALDHHAGIP